MAVFKRSRSNVPLSLKKKAVPSRTIPQLSGFVKLLFFGYPQKRRKDWLVVRGGKRVADSPNVVPVKSTKKETGPSSQIVFFSSGEAKRGRISTWSCE